MKIVRWIFLFAGILGLLPVIHVTYRLLLSEEELLPELSSMGLFFYVFLLQYACWQFLFFLISRDPVRYRPMMILAFFIEVSVPFNSAWLFLYGFKAWMFLTVASIVFALLFLIAFWMTGRETSLSKA
jgi:hypothetical protein